MKILILSNSGDEIRKKKYGENPGILCDVGYDAANLAILAYRKGAKNGDDIRNTFHALNDYRGASGEISFDENGDVHKAMLLKTIKNGKFVEQK